MSNPLVSIIIVNWNGLYFLDECFSSLSKISYKNIEVIFVDNASSDGSLEFVRKNYPKYIVIVNKTNLGYAEGHNIAYQHSKGDAVLFLNTDVKVEENLLDELIQTLYSKENIGAVQPKLLLTNSMNQIDSIGAFLTNTGFLYHYGREKDADLRKYNTTMPIYSAKGACIIFKREVLEKTDLFDKDYFAYFEETDLSHRVWLAGYTIIYSPKVHVYHKGGGASKQMPSSFILFHSYKNRIMTYIKNLSVKNLIKIMFPLLFLYEVATIVHIITGKFSVAYAIQKSIFWNITHLNATLKKRKHIQSQIRKVSDDSFLGNITKKVRPSYYFYLFTGLGKYVDDNIFEG